ncbi:hypothetical protein C8Q80DRAFT_473427 [Daedaleopsis nitida]|nr:hypothetical protein C8Q80DRAFT_473427 [Daedaleopsis nitida]
MSAQLRALAVLGGYHCQTEALTAAVLAWRLHSSSSSTTMSSPIYPPHHSAGAGPSSARSSYYRPATIAELAAQAQENLWDPSKGLKHWLRTAEKARRNAEALIQNSNFEGAFVEYAKAATIVLEKLPTHREYQTLLNADQRHNLGMVSTQAIAGLVNASDGRQCPLSNLAASSWPLGDVMLGEVWPCQPVHGRGHGTAMSVFPFDSAMRLQGLCKYDSMRLLHPLHEANTVRVLRRLHS